MISTVDVKAGGQTHKMKLSTRAMRALERETGRGVANLFAELSGGGFRVSVLASIIREVMNDGKGGTDADADDLIDMMGIKAAAEAVTPVIEAAFAGMTEDAPSGGSAKNAKRAA